MHNTHTQDSTETANVYLPTLQPKQRFQQISHPSKISQTIPTPVALAKAFT